MRIASPFSPIFRRMGRALEGVFIVAIVIQVERENGVVCFWRIVGWLAYQMVESCRSGIWPDRRRKN